MLRDQAEGRRLCQVPNTTYQVPLFVKDHPLATWAAGSRKHFEPKAHCIVFCSLLSRGIKAPKHSKSEVSDVPGKRILNQIAKGQGGVAEMCRLLQSWS